MKMKKLMSPGIAMVLTLSMMLTGCSGNDKKNDEEGIEQTAEKECRNRHFSFVGVCLYVREQNGG